MNHLSILDEGVGQLGFIVEDLEATMHRYHRVFGRGGWQIYTYGPRLLSVMRRHGQPATYSCRIGLSYFGQSRIELIQPLEGDTVYSEYVEKHGYGVQHLGIYVKEIEPALEEVRAAGIAVTMEGGGFGLDGDGYFAYLDTEEHFGVTYELIQRPKRRHEPEAIFPSGGDGEPV